MSPPHSNPEISPRQALLWREGLALLVGLALLCLAAAFYPLEPVGPPTADLAAPWAKAPWIFLGLQELLIYLPARVGGLVLPLAGLGLLAWLPWLGHRRGPELPAYAWPAGADWPGWLVLAAGAALTWAGWWR
ncbi:MAG: hypothetical protein KQJ78_01735 [Deltaproteobacteria bacterium]|nr:hypothetical protein [Deltaproteobacteria bacterium]